MGKENRGGRPFAGLTVAAILLASTAGYVSALSRMFQSPAPFLSEENDFSFEDAGEVRAAAPEIASFQQAFTRTAPAWFVNAMPGYSSGRARELWYLSLNRSGDGRLAYEAFGGVNDSTNPYQTFNVALFNNLAPVSGFVGSKPTTATLAPLNLQQVWKNTNVGVTDFNAGPSWTSGVAPGAGDVAAFSGAQVSQPNLTANTSISGLYFSGAGTNGYDLTRTSTQTLTLTATGTTIGAETGDANSVAIGAENTSGTNTIDVPLILAPSTSTSTFFQATGGTLVINGIISGTGINLTKTGGGTLTLNGQNTYTGTTTISEGTLSANDIVGTGSIGGSSVTTAVVLGSASTTGTLSYTGAAATYVRGFTVNAGGGKLVNAGSGLLTLGTTPNGVTIASGGTLTFDSGTNGITVNNGTVISGLGGVTMNSSGAGVLQMGSGGSSSNTYAGPTNLSQGNLTLAGSSTVTGGVLASGPFGTGTVHIGSGTNAVALSTNASSGTTRSIENNISLDGDVVFALGSGQTSGRIALNTLYSGSGSGASLLTVPNTIVLTRTNQLTVNSSVVVDLIGAVSGSFGLTKLGGGTLNIGSTSTTASNFDANANTYTGLTTVSAGTVLLTKTAGTDAIAGNLTIDGTGLVVLNHSNQIKDASDLTINGSGVFDLSGSNEAINSLNGSGTITNNSALASASTFTTGSNNGGGTFSGTIQNGAPTKTVALTKTGSGTLILAGGNTYTGDTTIAGGELFLTASGSLAATSTIRLGDIAINSPSAMFTFGSTSGGVTMANPLIVQASASGTEGTRTLLGLAESGNTNTWTGNITLNTDLTVQSAAVGSSVANGPGILLFQGGAIDVKDNNFIVNSNLRANNADTYSIQGNVVVNEVLGSSLATGGGVFKEGSGTLILQGTSNTYTGTDAGNLNNAAGTRIGLGILAIYGDGSLGFAPTNAANNVYFVAPTTNTNTDSIGPTLRADAAGITLASTRNINIASGITARFDSNGNTFTIAGNINGAGNLNKVGPGILALTGANTYTGTTTVSAGTLNAAVTNALGGTTGSITVNRGGTLLVSGDGNLNRINDTTPIVLGSATGSGTATFQKGDGVGVSEGTGASRNGVTVTGTSSAGLGALSLQSNATFDFGSVGVGTFTFGTFTSNTNTLTILNWTSNANALTVTSGVDGTDDRLIFSGAPTDIGSINFNGTPATFILLDTGFYEVVPVPVPEPSTWIGAGLALAAVAVSQRKRVRRLFVRA